MSDVKPALESAGFTVAQTSYGRFGILRFLTPFRWRRNKAISRVATDIRTARRSYKIDKGNDPKRMSVISHSFGTYVVGRLLTDYPDFQWYRIVFCSSVVREDFPLHQVLERFSHPLLNEIGTKDFLPALAESAGWGYGSVGSTGFNRPPVESRWHHGYSHSDFLTEEFCKDFWIPFLQGHRPKPADKPAQMPFLVRLICKLPLRWAIVILAVAVLFWSARAIEGNVEGFFQSVINKIVSKRPLNEDAPATNKDLTPSMIAIGFMKGKWEITSGGITTRGGGTWIKSLGRGVIRVEKDIVRISGQGFDCVYHVNLIYETMNWSFQAGDGRCPRSVTLRRVAE